MTTVIDPDKLLMWVVDDHVVTADVRKEGGGYTCEWWVSSNFGSALQVVGVFNFPVHGETEEQAKQRVNFLLDDVIYIAKTFYGGDGNVIIPVDRDGGKKKRETLAMMHLAGHWKNMSAGLGIIERTGEEYKFLKQFKVSNVAQVIASIEGVKSVRTVHERIFLAKQKGYIG
jgi:hypothetical protein